MQSRTCFCGSIWEKCLIPTNSSIKGFPLEKLKRLIAVFVMVRETKILSAKRKWCQEWDMRQDGVCSPWLSCCISTSIRCVCPPAVIVWTPMDIMFVPQPDGETTFLFCLFISYVIVMLNFPHCILLLCYVLSMFLSQTFVFTLGRLERRRAK